MEPEGLLTCLQETITGWYPHTLYFYNISLNIILQFTSQIIRVLQTSSISSYWT
jgi:hypothetical protein